MQEDIWLMHVSILDLALLDIFFGIDGQFLSVGSGGILRRDH